MRKRIWILFLTVVLALSLSLPGPALASDAAPEAADGAAVQTEEEALLTLSEREVTVFKGKSVKLTPALAREDKKARYTWTTSDKNIATVSGGTVSGRAAGTATITCTAALSDGTEVSAECAVTVRIAVTGLRVNSNRVIVNEGSTAAPIELTVAPADASDQTVTWASDSPSVATVDGDGRITGVSLGKAVVTATANDGSGRAVKISVTVNRPVGSLALSSTSETIARGKSVRLTANIRPDDATNKKLVWSTSDASVATVSNGTIAAKKAGRCTITCETADGSGLKATCSVTVIQGVQSISTKKRKVVLTEGSSAWLDWTVAPADATNKTLSWSSASHYIASVQNGRVTANRKGTTEITGTTTDGTNKSIKFSIIVEPKVPLTLESSGRGVYMQNMMALTVKNQTATQRIVDFDFNVKLYSINGSCFSSGSYSLGKKESIGPGQTRTIKRTLNGFSYAASYEITITGVTFSDGSYASIPYSAQQTWSFRSY